MENGMACNTYWESLCGCNLQSVNEWINELPLTDTWTNFGLFLVILTWKGVRSYRINSGGSRPWDKGGGLVTQTLK